MPIGDIPLPVSGCGRACDIHTHVRHVGIVRNHWDARDDESHGIHGHIRICLSNPSNSYGIGQLGYIGRLFNGYHHDLCHFISVIHSQNRTCWLKDGMCRRLLESLIQTYPIPYTQRMSWLDGFFAVQFPPVQSTSVELSSRSSCDYDSMMRIMESNKIPDKFGYHPSLLRLLNLSDGLSRNFNRSI